MQTPEYTWVRALGVADRSSGEYIEGVPNGNKITLRQIASMTSGIASYTEDEQWGEEAFADPRRSWKPEELA